MAMHTRMAKKENFCKDTFDGFLEIRAATIERDNIVSS